MIQLRVHLLHDDPALPSRRSKETINYKMICFFHDACVQSWNDHRQFARMRLSSDGALRGDGQAAAGMTLIAYDEHDAPHILYRAGKLLGKLQSAFEAEILALEWSLSSFLGIVGAVHN